MKSGFFPLDAPGDARPHTIYDDDQIASVDSRARDCPKAACIIPD